MAEPIDWDAAYVAELPRVYNFFLYKVGDKEFAQDLTATTLNALTAFEILPGSCRSFNLPLALPEVC